MNKLNKELETYLNELDKNLNNKKQSERDSYFFKIGIWIKENLKKQEKIKKITLEEESEAQAFRFSDNLSAKNFLNEGFFHFFIGLDGEIERFKKTVSENPEYLIHWKKRAKEVKSPILISLYAGITIQFASKKKDYFEVLEIFAKANLELIKKNSFNIVQWNLDSLFPFDQKKELYDLFRISFNISTKLAKKEKNELYCGVWGFPLQYIVRNFKYIKNFFKKNEIEEIIEDYKKRLLVIKDSSAHNFYPYVVLADYYLETKNKKKLIEVLQPVSSFINKNMHPPNVSDFELIILRKTILNIYKKYKKLIPNEYKTIEQKILNIKYDSKKIMDKSFSYKTDLTEEIKMFKEAVFKEKELSKQLYQISTIFSISIDSIKKFTSERSSSSFFTSSYLKIDENKTLRADFRKEDILEDEKIIFDAGESTKYGIHSLILNHVVNEIKALHKDSKDIYLLFKKNEFFNDWTNIQNNILKKALEAYWDENYLISSHLMVSIIEGVIYKTAVISSSENIHEKYNIKKNEKLNSLLKKTKIFESIFSENDQININLKTKMSEDFCFHLRFLLSSNYGYNFRNLLQHGMSTKMFADPNPSNWFFQILCFFLNIKISISKKEQ